jgi:hypothetical protein
MIVLAASRRVDSRGTAHSNYFTASSFVEAMRRTRFESDECRNSRQQFTSASLSY